MEGEPKRVIAEHVDESSGKKYYDLKCTVEEPHYGIQEKIAWWVDEDHLYRYLDTSGVLPWYYFQPQRGRSNNSISLVRSRITRKKFFELWELVKNSKAGEPGFYFTNDKAAIVFAKEIKNKPKGIRDKYFVALMEDPRASISTLKHRVKKMKTLIRVNFYLSENFHSSLVSASKEERKNKGEIARDAVISWLRNNGYTR